VDTDKQEFEALFHGRGQGVARVSLEGTFTKVNQYFADLLGYSVSQLESKRWQDITHPGDIAADEAMVAKLAAGTSDSYHMEKRYLHRRTSNAVWVDLHVRAIRDETKKCTHFMVRILPLPEISFRTGESGSEKHSRHREGLTIPKSWLLWLKDNWKTVAILMSLASGGAWKGCQSLIQTQKQIEDLQDQLDDSNSNATSRDG
jgi:PAS domain S-box-containing protein